MSSARLASCLFCSRKLPFQFFMGAPRIDCPDCGSYEVTVGAMNQLRGDVRMKSAVHAEIRRQLGSGVRRPRMNLDDVEALKGR